MLPKRARFWLVLFVIVSLLSLGSSCSKDEDDEDEGPDDTTGTTAAVPYQSKGNEGTITGNVTFSGAAPAPKPIDMSADAACSTKNPNATAEDLVVKDGKLEYAFIYIKDGQTADGKKISGLSFPVPGDSVKLDQDGCHYKPHVLGIQTKQKFEVVNSDPTAHNVNVQPNSNPKWNQSQPPSAPPIVKSFDRAETLIPVKCNQHPWMKAYIGVLNHPFYGVSREDGTFEIKGVPPGKYTVVAWHEKWKGEKTMEVTVPEKGSTTADFAFDGSAMASVLDGGSLEVLPALELPMLMQH